LVIILARTITFDMLLTFFVTVAMVSYWLAETDDFQQAWRHTIFFAAMGIAAITKGPVGFLLPLLSVSAYLAVRGRLRELRKLRWGLGVPVFLAPSLPWFVAVSVRNPDFPKYALWQESLMRFATGYAHRPGGPLYYVPVFLGGFLPWSFFLVFAGWNRLTRLLNNDVAPTLRSASAGLKPSAATPANGPQRTASRLQRVFQQPVKAWRELRQEDHKPHLFLLAWAVVVFVFFSISRSKLPGYFLPAMIPLSILMARVWAELDAPASGRRPDWLTAGFATLVALGLLISLSPQLLRFHNLQLLAARKIPPPVMPFIRPSLLFAGLILAGLGVLGRNLSGRLRAGTLSPVCFTILALTTPLLMARWIVPLEVYATSSSSRKLAQTILESPERDLPVYGYYYFRTGLPFYLRRSVGLVTGDAGELTGNYIASRWKAQRQLRSLGSPCSPGFSRDPVGTGQPAWHQERMQTDEAAQRGIPKGYPTTGAANRSPVLIDESELQACVEASSTPWVVLLRGDRVAQLAQTLGSLEPLWEGRDYSVWKVQAGGTKIGIYRLR
jgi:4-amino-4-deoxy-L-arabinose transferase-like glycosyltransferase